MRTWGYKVVTSLILFGNVQKQLITKFIMVNKQMSFIIVLEMGSLLVRTMAMERVVEYMLRVQIKPLLKSSPRITWKTRKISEKYT